MDTWFTVRLTDRPGSLARLASGLGEQGVNITGIVGVAEDTDGTLMLTTSDVDATRDVLRLQGFEFVEHDAANTPGDAFEDVRSSLTARGLDLGREGG